MALYYWVGGTNTWNATATGKWSNLSGNPPFYTTNPGAGDDVIFDSFSTAGTVVTLGAGSNAIVGSITFATYPGTFTFAANLSSGNTTLGASTTYTASGGNPTTYTFTPRNVNSTFTANGKVLPTNLFINLNGTTLTFAGNADFGGNITTAATGHFIKSTTGIPCNLRIGGNISLSATTTNPTDQVTIKGYGTSKTYATGNATTNAIISFVSGSSYSPSASSGLAGTCSLTVEIGGQFTVPNPLHRFSNAGTVTLSGFNSSNNNSYFFGLFASNTGTIVLSNDTVIKSSITITAFTTTISSTAGAKLLLEGDFLATSGANYTIDILEFSGTTASVVSATTIVSNLQIKQFIINKTGAGSVTFSPSSTTSPFTLYIPNGQTYSWTHTSGTVTQSGNSIIQINGQSTTAVFSYSTSFPAFRFSNLQIRAGKINCISELKCVYLKLYMSGGIEFTSPALLGFTADTLVAINATNTGLSIVLKSLATYSILTELTMFGNLVGGTLALNASTLSPATRAIFNLETTAQQTVEAVNPNSIDSSGTNNVAPFSKQTIYSLNGTLTSTINWSNTVQPPPIAAKITVGYTFVN
jgi:hypothetical protein